MPLAAVPGAIYATILARSAGDDSVKKAEIENDIEAGKDLNK